MIMNANTQHEIIYQDELFTFTTDDLYFNNRNANLTCISLDISRYFNIKCSSFHTRDRNNNIKNYPFVINESAKINMHKYSFITLNYHNILPHIQSGNFSVNYLSNYYINGPSFKLIPDDTIVTNETIRSMFEKKYKIISLDKVQNNRLSKIRYTDRKYRSLHHNMNIKKHIHNLQTKIHRIMEKNIITEQEKNTIKKYDDIIANSDIKNIYKNMHIYKKLKQLNHIKNVACIKNPLYKIAKDICEVLYNESSHKEEMSYIKRTLYISNYKEFYKFLRMQYVLISLKRYDDAAKLFIYKNYATCVYSNYEKAKVPDVNCTDISKKTINTYKKRFDQLYYQISKYRYKIKDVNDKDCTNINYYIIPEIKKQIANIFKSYAVLYNMQTSSSPERKRFFYSFENYNNNRLGILLVKPKFF